MKKLSFVLGFLIFFDSFYYLFSIQFFYSKSIIKYKRYASAIERHTFLKFVLPYSDKSWILGDHNELIDYTDFDTLSISSKNLTFIKRVLQNYRCIRSITNDNLFYSRDLKFLNRQTNKLGLKTPYFLQADLLWSIGIRGEGVKVGIFDTGINEKHQHFQNARIVEITNWTDEPSATDTIGHGTFVTGLFVSDPMDNSCSRGISPDVEVYIFRVFTRKQTSYTSWFLDAFNYAVARNIQIINLSIGGPDFQDYPFVEKVWELSANGVLMVSANGNDGPIYGTQNNPADQMDVVGVGAIDFHNHVTNFSSRGMTTWELPSGYGRIKPDVVTYSSQLLSTSHTGGCKQLSGTSVASPSIAAIAALLISSTPTKKVSPGLMKQILLSTATRLTKNHNGNGKMYNIFEQGMGRINLISAYRALQEVVPQVTAYPSYIDFTECPYMWPYCIQPLYSSAMPAIVNVTLVNSMAVSGYIKKTPRYIALTKWNGEKISVAVSYSENLWPWSGYLAISISVPDEYAVGFTGEAVGYVEVIIESKTEGDLVLSWTLHIPIRVSIVPRPPRRKRILWDQFHNLRYPPGYIPRDNVRRQEPLDWTGDHIHTNFKDSYSYLRSKGYFIEVLGSHYGCFNADNYGYLIIPDPEDEYFPSEIAKLYNDVTNKGLSLIVLAEWYNTDLMKHLKFYDENTRRWWTPDTGGANIPALNDLLDKFNIQLSSQVLEGNIKIGDHQVYYRSGTTISEFPSSADHISRIIYASSFTDLTSELVKSTKAFHPKSAIIGLYGGPKSNQTYNNTKHGRVVIFGDSDCIDDAYREKDCLWLWDSFLQYSETGHLDPTLAESVSIVHPQLLKSYIGNSKKPQRLKGSRLHKFSSVIRLDPISEKQVYRKKPECPGRYSDTAVVLKTVFDNSVYFNESWFKPHKLTVKENKAFQNNFHPIFNRTLYTRANYQKRRPQMHNHPPHVIPQPFRNHHKPSDQSGHSHNNLTAHSRQLLFYLICVISSSCIMLIWLYRRLRMKICYCFNWRLRSSKVTNRVLMPMRFKTINNNRLFRR